MEPQDPIPQYQPETPAAPKDHRQSKPVIVLLILLVLAVGACTYLLFLLQKDEAPDQQSQSSTPGQQITNFDECVAAGNPVMESFPEQCSANGQTFVNDTQAASPEESVASNGFEHIEESGQKAFSMIIPDGWSVIKPLDQDSFYMMGTAQPEIAVGTAPKIEETESFGTDASSVFSVTLLPSYDESFIQGTPEDFSVGKAEDELKGKKYTYIFESDELEGIGYQRFKGDRNYTYVLNLPDGKVIIASYAVYGSDPRNLVETIDEVIGSIRLN